MKGSRRKRDEVEAVEEPLPGPPDGGAVPEKRVPIDVSWESLFETIGKQVVEIRAAHAVAYDATERANSLYQANQDLGGVVARLTALLEHHGIDPTEPLPG